MQFHMIILFLSAMLYGPAPLRASSQNLHHAVPDVIYGVTTDDGYDLVDLPVAIKSLSRKVCTRIVFDENVPATDYAAGASALHQVGCVMALISDSSTLASYSSHSYLARFQEYVDILSEEVDIWEIGNEVNGSWTGSSSAVSSKISGAFDLAKQRRLTTALTLYYNTPCETESEREMFRWSREHISDRVRFGLDYLFISYYDDDCPGPAQDWNNVFRRLVHLFPNSKVGFGEIGTNAPGRKKDLIKRYYELSKPGAISEPKFVGGYFYWYFHEDMVPKTKPLWSYFDDILRHLP